MNLFTIFIFFFFYVPVYSLKITPSTETCSVSLNDLGTLDERSNLEPTQTMFPHPPRIGHCYPFHKYAKDN